MPRPHFQPTESASEFKPEAQLIVCMLTFGKGWHGVEGFRRWYQEAELDPRPILFINFVTLVKLLKLSKPRLPHN